MSVPAPVLRRRLEPLVEAVLQRYGAQELVPFEAVVDAVIDGLVSREKRTFLTARDAILRESSGLPQCWICKLLIPMDAPADSYASFSIDHVIERRSGGMWYGHKNLRPAHRLCNSLRSNPPKPKTKRKYEAFLAALARAQGVCTNIPDMV